MFPFIITVHVLVSIFLIFVILLQPGKGDGMAALGGGGNASSVFGGRGSVTFLSKVTTGCAIIFLSTSLLLAWRSSHSDSVLRARRNLAAADAAKNPGAKAPAGSDAAGTAPAAPASDAAGSKAATPGATAPAAPAPAANAPAAPAPAAQAPAPAPAKAPAKNK